MKRWFYGVICSFSLVVLMLLPAAPAQAQPTLDGLADTVYTSNGEIIDYQGFVESANAQAFVLDDTSIDPNNIWILWEITNDFNDNSYGETHPTGGKHTSWDSGHTFDDLAESDNQRMLIYNSCGELVMDATMDILDGPLGFGPSYATPSTYDVSMDATESIKHFIQDVPAVADDWTLFSYQSSTAYNLNSTGYCSGGSCLVDSDGNGSLDWDLLVNSPPFADEPNYVPIPSLNLWQYNLQLEMRLDRRVFITALCPEGGPRAPAMDPIELHASPSKPGASPVSVFREPAAIGDTVWLDIDRDGIRDIGEPGIANVIVHLYSDVDGDGVIDPEDSVLETTVTDLNGEYLFADLGERNYIVDVLEASLPSGLTATVGTGDTHGSIDLDLGEIYLDADFGYAPTDAANATLGDFVWSDNDSDGLQDAGEPGIAGVTVTLLEAADPDGIFNDVVTTTVTDAAGFYLFTGVAEGEYVVQVTDGGGTPLAGYTATSGAQSIGGSTSPPQTVEAGDVILDVDFGYATAGLGSIGNQVWDDLDRDGAYEPLAGEGGIEGVTVNLALDLDGDGAFEPLGNDGIAGTADDEPVVATAVTDSSGQYSFDGLVLDDGGGDSDADYLVFVTDTGFVLDGFLKSLYGTTGVDGQNQREPAAVTLSAGTTSADWADFGYLQPPGETFDGGLRGQVGDRVWLDFDGDGIQDPGEAGIEGVVMELWEIDNNGNLSQAESWGVPTVTTGADGLYLFSRLTLANGGTDFAVVVAASNFAPGGALEGYSATSDDDGRQDTGALTGTTTNFQDLTLDFGYRFPTTTTAAIGDRVWLDADADGVQDAEEPGFANVTIGLYQDDGDGVYEPGTDDILVDTTSTGGDGGYLFTGLAAGSYWTVVTDQGGILDTSIATGDPDESGTCSTCDERTLVTVAGGETFTTADFGYQTTPRLIGDFVWVDVDGDGVQDAGEVGIEGVTLTLFVDVQNGPQVNWQVQATTTTDATGFYAFEGLQADDFRVVVDATNFNPGGALEGFTQTGDPDATLDDETSPIVLNNQNTFDLTADFGYQPPAPLGTLGNLVFSDVDGDGAFEPAGGDAGIDGITVDLIRDTNGDGVADPDGADNTFGTADDEPIIATTTTSGGGAYLFSGLPTDDGDGDADYLVTVTDAAGTLRDFTQTTGTAGVDNQAQADPYAVSLSPGSPNNLTADFGFQSPLFSIGDFVWLDADGDGFQDAGEVGIEGVTLELRGSTGAVLATTTTDANGFYTFFGLADGTYTVAVTDENGVLTGYDLTSGVDVVTLTLSGASRTDVDFGYVREPGLGSIGDRVWLDGDGDGFQDSAEDGIAGVTVELFDPGPDGAVGGGDDVLLASTVTGTDGRYLFSGLTADFYYVQVEPSTLPNGGSDLVATTPNPTGLIALSEEEEYVLADFGFNSAPGLAAIGDFVWYDAVPNGIQDPGEVGIGGVTIEVTGPGCSPCTAVTDADGSYLITGLTPGDYTATFDPSTVPAPYSNVATNTQSYDLTLSAGELIAFVDFGFPAAGPVGSIGDTVFLDVDADGVQDVGETGIAGVTLNLIDPGTGTILATTETDANGNYDFIGLPAGSYQVQVTDIDRILDGLNLSGGSNPTSTIVLAAGQDFDDADFPYAPADGTGTLGNLVWRDLNNDGDRDAGEPGISGVEVSLWLDVNGNGVLDLGTDNLLRSTTTDANGQYSFVGLEPDNYLVDVTDTKGVLTGLTKTSGTTGVDNNSQADPYAVALTALAPNNLTADFGYFAPANLALSGTAFFDREADGLLNGDDFGVPDVTLFLYRDLDGNGIIDPKDPLLGTQVAAFDGTYSFTNLAPGDYVIAADATGSFVDGAEQTTQTLTATVEPVGLVASNSTGHDFGYTFNATLALVSDLAAYWEDGSVVVEWQTASEIGTGGFVLYRWSGTAQEWSTVHESMIPAPAGASHGSVYRIVDQAAATAPLDALHHYALMEIQRVGNAKFYGPYATTVADSRTEALRTAVAPTKAAPAAPGANGSAQARPMDPWTRARQDQRAADANADRPRPTPPSARRLRIAIADDGVYRIGLDQIAEALSLQPQQANQRLKNGNLDLSTGGESVAWTADGDALLFYAQGIDGNDPESAYLRRRVYWLTRDRGATMDTTAPTQPQPAGDLAFLSEQHFEQDVFAATFVARNPDLDFWHWRALIGGNPTSGRATFPLPATDPATGSLLDASLTVHLRGASDGLADLDHRVIVRVNGTPVGETVFAALNDQVTTFPVPVGVLVEGDNAVEVEAMQIPGNAQSFVYVDAFDLAYPRHYRARENTLTGAYDGHERITVEGFTAEPIVVLDISDPHTPRVIPVRISGSGGALSATFAAPSAEGRFVALAAERIGAPAEMVGRGELDLLSPSRAAEYLVITRHELLPAAERLAALRSADGLSTEVLDLEDIANEVNHGHLHPAVVRDFLRAATDRRPVAPRYVVLLGTGTFDYRDIWGIGGNLIPPLLVSTPFGLYASDTSLGDLDGDGTPEVAVGRIPVFSPAEADTYIDKLEAYAATPPLAPVTLVADNADLGGNFAQVSEQLAQRLPQPSSAQRIYLDFLDPAPAIAATQEAILAGPEWFNYIGHGGIDRFADEGLLTVPAVAALGKAERPTIVSSLSCTISRFEFPGFLSLGEALLLHPSAAVAVWAPAGLAFHFDSGEANRILMEEIYQAGPEESRRLGDILNRTLQRYEDAALYSFDVDVYTLLGDPAILVQ